MLVVAITGGLGAGKSTVSRHLQARGAVVVELDGVAKDLLAEDPQLLARVVERFGPDVVGADGRLDRSALAEVAFSTRESAAELDALVHPATIARTRRLVADLAASASPPPLVVLEIPLLVEAPELMDSIDEVLAISAAEETRILRAVSRGMSQDDARHRVACQSTDIQRAVIADTVLTNDGDLAALRSAVDCWFEERIASRMGRA